VDRNAKGWSPYLCATSLAKRQAWRLAQEQNADLMGFCWSPDSRRVAYVWRQRHEGNSRDTNQRETESFLMVADRDGSNAMTLLSEKANGPNAAVLVTLAWPDWR
jgi:Tol biopolymer transport system component